MLNLALSMPINSFESEDFQQPLIDRPFLLIVAQLFPAVDWRLSSSSNSGHSNFELLYLIPLTQLDSLAPLLDQLQLGISLLLSIVGSSLNKAAVALHVPGPSVVLEIKLYQPLQLEA